MSTYYNSLHRIHTFYVYTLSIHSVYNSLWSIENDPDYISISILYNIKCTILYSSISIIALDPPGNRLSQDLGILHSPAWSILHSPAWSILHSPAWGRLHIPTLELQCLATMYDVTQRSEVSGCYKGAVEDCVTNTKSMLASWIQLI